MATPEGVLARPTLAEDPGFTSQPINIGTPAVASGFTHEIPGASVQRIVTVSFSLTTDANVANRIPFVSIFAVTGDGIVQVASPFAVAASKTSNFTFGIGLQQFGATSAAAIGGPLPDLRLAVGMAVSVGVTAIQAGDQVDDILLFVDQWPVRD